MVANDKCIRLCHVATVPVTLLKLMGPQFTWFRQRGYEIAVISSPGAHLEEVVKRFGVEAIPVAMTRAISPMADAAALLRLSATLVRRRFDIVHVHTPKASLLGTLAAVASMHPNRMYTLRGIRYEEMTGLRRIFFRSIERLVCRLNCRVICVSASSRQVAIVDRLCGSSRLRLLASGSSNGIDVDRFANAAGRLDAHAVRERLGIPAGAPVVGFVGRITRDKGIHDLLAASHRMRQSGCHIHLVIIGPWDDTDPVELECRRSIEEEKWIHHLASVDEPEKYYAALDVLVFPSYREGFPNVVLEAAASRVPTVGYRVTGVKDAVVHEQTGLLVNPRDWVSLADSVIRLIHDTASRFRMGVAAWQRVESEFRPERIWQALDDEYRALLAGQ